MTLTPFTPLEGLAGGVMIGLATVAWLWLYGRVTGISGILGEAVLGHKRGERGWRLMYLAGLIAGALLYLLGLQGRLPGTYFGVDLQASWPVMILAGLLVGFGTRMGHGCTSGHGVCGLARLSGRSMVATAIFMGFGLLTVFVTRHILGLA